MITECFGVIDELREKNDSLRRQLDALEAKCARLESLIANISNELLATDYFVQGEAHKPNLISHAKRIIHERSQLRAKCADLRADLGNATREAQDYKKAYIQAHENLKNALSDDCGKPLLNKIERLRDELSRLKDVVGEVDIELINQTLEETK